MCLRRGTGVVAVVLVVFTLLPVSLELTTYEGAMSLRGTAVAVVGSVRVIAVQQDRGRNARVEVQLLFMKNL